ncbi:MAG: hypothetical protein DWQ19_11265 [Crenarchaeota archaeon]|nr:MAG: hypothetical protein DWQ19_11265 [Thermoproteota archaeon]
MLSILKYVVNNLSVPLSNQGNWNSLYIDYEKPIVERLWTTMQIDGIDYRIYLHKIYPCEKEEALFHPHPWPSAMVLCQGNYETVIGYGEPDATTKPRPMGPFYLSEGSVYQMLTPFEWHYVRPIKEPCITLMVAGPPYSPAMVTPPYNPNKNKPELRPLTKQESQPIFDFFLDLKNRLKILEALDGMGI